MDSNETWVRIKSCLKKGRRVAVIGRFRKIWSIGTTILVILVALLAIALVGVRLFGYTPYAILSGSMTPQYQVGDLIYVREVAPEKIKPGDVITFVADENLTIVTHRVSDVNPQERSFTTKGDANSTEDANPVLYENVLGVVQFSLPKLGFLSQFFASPSGRYVGIAILLALVLLMLLPGILKNGRAKPDKTNGSKAQRR